MTLEIDGLVELDVEPLFVVCQWPGGPHDDVVISMDGGQTAWCLSHDGDDFLGVLEPGTLAACEVCGKTCLTWTRRACLHEECRRDHLLRQTPRTATGAYARRQERQP